MNEIERSCVTAVRTLTIDAINKSNSGHPGMPMGMAALAYLLYGEVLKHDPKDPHWPDRDRLVLSCGHGSMWQYAGLHLSGYDLSIDDIKQFRQWGSKTPGHPELDRHVQTPGVEMTTGPLGQGCANTVGMAMAEVFLREHYGKDVIDHHTYAVVSDGDLMEGISAEAASIAGQIGLGRLTWFYDDNDISLDGPTSLSFSREDVSARFEAYGWQVLDVGDADDLDSLRRAIKAGHEELARPTLIHVHSIIGYPSPNKMGKSASHGAPLGPEEARLTKEALGVDPDKEFDVPESVYHAFSAVARGGEAHTEWNHRFQAWQAANPELAQEWSQAFKAKPPKSLDGVIPTTWDKDKLATRAAGGKVMAAFEAAVPTMIGGAADLTESTKTIFPKSEQFTHEAAGRNIFFGVREHAMGGIVNGLAAHGGIVRPYGSTFLQFADYMRGSIRLSALMGLNVAWVFTHDSVAVGEDGPTHQPIEHFAALRAIPELVVLRPADATETAEAWRVVLEDLDGPGVLILSRQDLPVLDRTKYGTVKGVARGGYVLSPAGGDEVGAIVATGSEVSVALAAQAQLAEDGTHVRVVSLPSWELFEDQDDTYRDEVLPKGLPTVSVEAGIRMGWERYAQAHVSIDRFGASAPGALVLEKLGITPDHVISELRSLLAKV
ncbi:MAG: transketolase [Solirubrobacteraceae bacterium]|nr:transketolase [Solirubrobacteraceae bacterium]